MSQSETINGNQSVYEHIVYQLDEIQPLRQELVKKAESGDCEDPKMCKSKQKDILTMSTQ